MIYDYQDSCTKMSLARLIRDWANIPSNAAIVLNLRVKELTDLQMSANSTDDIVWTVLYLLGLGLLHYTRGNIKVKGQVKGTFNVMIDPKWQEPPWVHDKTAMTNLKNHVDLMMDMLDNPQLRGVEMVALKGALDVIKIKRRRFAPPKPPVVGDLEWERRTIKARRLDEQQKTAFHRR